MKRKGIWNEFLHKLGIPQNATLNQKIARLAKAAAENDPDPLPPPAAEDDPDPSNPAPPQGFHAGTRTGRTGIGPDSRNSIDVSPVRRLGGRGLSVSRKQRC